MCEGEIEDHHLLHNQSLHNGVQRFRKKTRVNSLKSLQQTSNVKTHTHTHAHTHTHTHTHTHSSLPLERQAAYRGSVLESFLERDVQVIVAPLSGQVLKSRDMYHFNARQPKPHTSTSYTTTHNNIKLGVDVYRFSCT